MSIKTNILLETGTNELEIVEFTIDVPLEKGGTVTQSFGINVAKVREIIKIPVMTEIPNSPECVLGVINLRNAVIPVVDLTYELFGQHQEPGKGKLVITEFNRLKTGFLVSGVHRIHRISWKQVEAPNALQIFDAKNSAVVGIVKLEGHEILMIDVEKIIAELNPHLAGGDQGTPKQQSIGAGFKCIIAEDSPMIRSMLTEKLKFAGYDVMAFNDGLEASDYLDGLLKTKKTREELLKELNFVITDIEMPRMDGFSLVKKIKGDRLLANLPVLIFSSIIAEDMLHKGSSVGADAQLTKPQITLLIDTVGALLEKYKQAPSI